jgi:hypothetical protein
MPTNGYVVQEGELYKVVQQLEKTELQVLKDDVEAADKAYTQAVTDLGNTNNNPDDLVAAANRRDEAKAALEDSKSELEVAEGVVAESPLTPAGNQPMSLAQKAWTSQWRLRTRTSKEAESENGRRVF